MPETLVPAIESLREPTIGYQNDTDFRKELRYYLEQYAGRPTPLYFAKNLTEYVGGARITLREKTFFTEALIKSITPSVKVFWQNG